MCRYKFQIMNKLNTPAEEAYKILRTNMQFNKPYKKIKSVAIVSWNPGEGKTTTAINLGIVISKLGFKVLLVDADLRKPMMIKHLGGTNIKGLSNYLMGNAQFSDVVSVTNIPDFCFAASGIVPSNPLELLNSQKFDDFLRKAYVQFDIVIIDTPPLGSVIDSAVIASKSDGALIVIKPGRMTGKSAQMARDQLGNLDSKILGAVFNNMKESDYRSYYSDYDYYGTGRKYSLGWLNSLKKRKILK